MRLTWPQIIEHPYIKGNLIVLNVNHASERPLTEELTTSQQIRKEKQRDEIMFNRGKKMIAEAMSKCQPAKPTNTLKKKQTNVIGDNESISSDDSINAIIQTDLETDVEGPLIKRETKMAIELDRRENQNLIIKRYTDNFATVGKEVVGNQDERGNGNLKIATMLENIEKMHIEDQSKWCAAKGKPLLNHSISKTPDNEANTNTELLKHKLGQNLENFSIRLSNDLADEESHDTDKDSTKEKAQW